MKKFEQALRQFALTAKGFSRDLGFLLARIERLERIVALQERGNEKLKLMAEVRKREDIAKGKVRGES